jgi:rusticyanin
MTDTISPPQTGASPRRLALRRRLAVIVAAAALAAGGLSAAVVLSLGGSSTSAPTAASTAAGYTYYQSVMGRYATGTGMMGGSGYTSMMGPTGYTWMMGGTAAPVWMTGGTLPGYITGTSADPGKVMGSLFANAPGPRVTPADAATLARRVPTGATVDRAANRVTFTTTTAAFPVVANPSMPAENFRVAGLTNPTIVVPAGAKVSIELVNADTDMAHGLVVTGSGTTSWMPMMTASPAFSGSALWFLGEATSAGMHEGTLTFTAGQAGTYQYLCPVPGHAQEGMAGTLTVS